MGGRATKRFNVSVQSDHSGRNESSGCCVNGVTGEPGNECNQDGTAARSRDLLIVADQNESMNGYAN